MHRANRTKSTTHAFWPIVYLQKQRQLLYQCFHQPAGRRVNVSAGLQVAVWKEHAAAIRRETVIALVSVLFEDLLRCDLYFLLLNHVSIIADEADHCVLVRPLFHDCLVPSEQLLYLQHTRHVVKNDKRFLVAEILRQLALKLVKSILLHPKRYKVNVLTSLH